MTGELIFVVGGAGSGKSKFALELAKKRSKKAAFVATSASEDGEMARKIESHQKERPAHWLTIEAAGTPFHIERPKEKIPCLLVDCLTLWVSAMLMKNCGREEILDRCKKFLAEARQNFKHVIVVSDEVGLGIVPENRLARDFREALGAVNQLAAQMAGQVFQVTVGLPVRIKGKSRA